jgi:RNase P subunit RPR2
MSEHHWRNEFTSNYLGSQHFLDGKDKVLTISSVKAEDLMTTDGSSKHSLVCYWKEDQLPMVLNKTNARQIAKLLKENDYTKWSGHKIQIFVDHAVKAFGDIVDGLRVRKKLPEDIRIACEECGQFIVPAFQMSVTQLAAYTKKKYGKTLCAECAKEKKEAEQDAAE